MISTIDLSEDGLVLLLGLLSKGEHTANHSGRIWVGRLYQSFDRLPPLRRILVV
jgi:hypothetical protein